jgi:hypothetical protein
LSEFRCLASFDSNRYLESSSTKIGSIGISNSRAKRNAWGEAEIEFSLLDSVHALPRNFQTFREIGLRPVPLCSEYAKTILHLYLRRTGGCASSRDSRQMMNTQDSED